VLKGDNSAH